MIVGVEDRLVVGLFFMWWVVSEIFRERKVIYCLFILFKEGVVI